MSDGRITGMILWLGLSLKADSHGVCLTHVAMADSYIFAKTIFFLIFHTTTFCHSCMLENVACLNEPLHNWLGLEFIVGNFSDILSNLTMAFSRFGKY